jgi:hypothetical protein
MKRTIIAMALLVMSAPILADKPAQCPCFRAEMIAGTCLRFLEDENLTSGWSEFEPGFNASDKSWVAFCGATEEALITNTDAPESWNFYYTFKENGFPECGWVHGRAVNGKQNLSEDEYYACEEEWLDAVELLGLGEY